MNVLVPIHLEKRTEYVEAEIQIRTVAMDCWATLDHKLRYKLHKEIPESLENSMLDCADDMMIIDKKMQKLYDLVKEIKEEVL